MIGGRRRALSVCLVIPALSVALTLAGCGTARHPPAVLSATVSVAPTPHPPVSHAALVRRLPSEGFVVSLSKRGVCRAAASFGVFANSSARAVKLTAVALRLSGIGATRVSTRFRMVRLRAGTRDSGLEPAKLRRLASIRAVGAIVQPERTSHLEYALLGTLALRHTPVRAWRIAGVAVSYRAGTATRHTVLRQNFHLPATRSCPR